MGAARHRAAMEKGALPTMRPKPIPRSKPYGIVTKRQLELLFKANGQPARKLAIHILTNTFKGEKLGPWEREQLESYLQSWGMADVDANEVVTAQLGMEAAEGVVGTRDGSAQAALRQLEEIGLIHRIAIGIRGHSSLYIVGPFSHGVEREAVGETISGGREMPPRKNADTTTEQRESYHGEQSTTWGNEVALISNSENKKPEAGEASEPRLTEMPRCPDCGGELLTKMQCMAEGLAYRGECGKLYCPECWQLYDDTKGEMQ